MKLHHILTKVHCLSQFNINYPMKSLRNIMKFIKKNSTSKRGNKGLWKSKSMNHWPNLHSSCVLFLVAWLHNSFSQLGSSEQLKAWGLEEKEFGLEMFLEWMRGCIWSKFEVSVYLGTFSSFSLMIPDCQNA